ncbi:MAG: TerC family protein [Acidimicrobiales bacterium]
MPLLLAAEVGSTNDRFVSVDVPPWAWVALLAVIGLLLGFDLVRHRDDHEPTYPESTMETLGWIGCGLAFGGVIAWAWGTQAFGEYLNGYLIEKALSVDNVFVWSMIFSSMAIPLRYQHRVLFWGIFGALVFRAVFIFAGSALILRFWWLLVIFGVFLVYTGVRVIRHRDDEGEDASTRGLGLLKRFVPVSDELDGHNFFTVKNGVRMATPLLAALVVVEFTDIIFAVDSVPAILAVSREPFLVFASNAFAILGLRAMYFLLANAKERFHFLSHALGAVLIFVGIKMTFSHWYHMNTYLSLAIIAGILVAGMVASQWRIARLAVGIHDEV